MANYEFQSSLYRTARSMLDAIAYEWLTSGGSTGPVEQRRFLSEMTDEALAAECIEGWGLDVQSGEMEAEDWTDPDSKQVPTKDSHMDTNSYDTADLVEAFARLRANRAEG